MCSGSLQVLSCISKSAASRLRKVILLLCSALVRPGWSAGSSAGLPSVRHGHTGWSPARGHEEDEGAGASNMRGEAVRAETV